MEAPAYDPRYLAGVLIFNRADFFEAHEVWEELWMNVSGPERSFVQGLIQAAVGLYTRQRQRPRRRQAHRTSRKCMETADQGRGGKARPPAPHAR